MSARITKMFGLLIALVMAPATAVMSATFAESVEGLEKREGLVTAYVDHGKARVLLELEQQTDGTFGRYIYTPYLTAGLGSNPVGLDRSSPAGNFIMSFRRAGDMVIAVVENQSFRATATNPTEKRAVETSFAQSVIWSTSIVAENEDGSLLIDFSSFLKRDARGVVAQLRNRGQGSFKLENSRSYVDTNAAHAFPRNLEFDAHVTFSSTAPGGEVRATTPVPQAVSLIMHTTLLALPDDGYTPREYDERAGLINTSYTDMSAPLDGSTVVNVARRFRLEKDASGNVVNPIIFYIDNGAPEPIRSALLEGARWWEDAFTAAGFPGGYKAEILPEGIHPLDARYNMVNWVHRATRGWSYGTSITDPRTGEVLRGVVILGSLRVRQDIKIFEALAGAKKTGTGAADDAVELALARIRQLSAHEIGHTLGFAHNMAASSYGRESVMDYPAPDVRMTTNGDGLDFSNVYGIGIGAWDKWATTYLYGDYAEDDAAAKAAMFREADSKGLIYVADRDSRSIGSGHIRGSLWDNGSDAVDELAAVMQVRAYALGRFGKDNLRDGESYEALQTKFVPLYLYHRYQLEAAAKFVGGYDFAYRSEGDGRKAPVPVSWSEQVRALGGITATIEPSALSIAQETLLELTPRGAGSGDPQFRRESFSGSASTAFSMEAAASAAIDVTLDALMHPARMQRLTEQKTYVEDHEGIQGVVSRVWAALSNQSRGDSAADTALRGIVLERITERLIVTLHNPGTGLLVRTEVRQSLEYIKQSAARMRGGLAPYGDLIARRIEDAFAQARTPAVKAPNPPPVPPGSPIGAMGESCWHCNN
ncbi:zinc-dependent metalloprotease [Kordiimonas aquimaris]|uniref:zinc-dependent metalloprotease n=1 Tax=Kordiimonas aquimaris TaxID=707591 RepID=UPI0021CF503B|nr:zinc-dependent metalloprotease [Kordiimonas aquimaris]